MGLEKSPKEQKHKKSKEICEKFYEGSQEGYREFFFFITMGIITKKDKI
jgi:hypothetical protein